MQAGRIGAARLGIVGWLKWRLTTRLSEVSAIALTTGLLVTLGVPVIDHARR